MECLQNYDGTSRFFLFHFILYEHISCCYSCAPWYINSIIIIIIIMTFWHTLKSYIYIYSIIFFYEKSAYNYISKWKIKFVSRWICFVDCCNAVNLNNLFSFAIRYAPISNWIKKQYFINIYICWKKVCKIKSYLWCCIRHFEIHFVCLATKIVKPENTLWKLEIIDEKMKSFFFPPCT